MQATARPDPYIGESLGHFRLIEKVGEGGYGAVYKAVHEGTGAFSAIKLLRACHENDHSAIERFAREVKSISTLRHPNIVQFLDFGDWGDIRYLAMEYLEGESLDVWLASQGSTSAQQLQAWVRQLCLAIAYVHDNQLIHRDLKPGNAFLVDTPDAGGLRPLKLLDFGLVRANEAESLTRSGVMVGSPLYMSPEQASGNSKRVQASSDIYSLGCMTFELLTGTTPFVGELRDIIFQHIRSLSPTLASIRPDFQWALGWDAFFLKAMAKEPTERFQDTMSFYESFADLWEQQQELVPNELYPRYGAPGAIDTRMPGHKDQAAPSGDAGWRIAKTMLLDDAALGEPPRRLWAILALVALALLVAGGLLWKRAQEPADKALVTGRNTPGAVRKRAPAFVRKAAQVKVKLVSLPVVAEVWQNQKRVGRTPYVFLATPHQKYLFQLKAKGFKDLKVEGSCSKHGVQTISVTLERHLRR